jgi:thiosulfate/3-mercaptopyruvate sulfurtransferase
MSVQTSIRGLATLALFAAPTLALAADEPQRHGSPLITHEKLHARLSDQKLRLLDARPRADYDQAHIPGAVWVDIKAIRELARPDSIRDEAAWSRALAPLGISEDTAAVFIYDNARQHDAAPVWWALTYAGVPRVGLVDGGFPLWQKDKRPVSSDAVTVTAREFKPNLHADRLATRDDVRQASTKGDIQLLDARSPEQYRGETTANSNNANNNKAAAGHIPGARNLDGYAIVDADGRFLEADALKSRLSEAGFTADRPIITYSQSGNRSAIVVFALERAGTPIRHYVPGLAEWTNDANAPIAAGREPNK